MKIQFNNGKRSCLGLLGLGMSGAGVFGANPLGTAYSIALYGNGISGLFAALMLMIGMTKSFAITDIVKYMSVFLMFYGISKVYQMDELKLNEYANAVICGMCVMAIEVVDQAMTGPFNPLGPEAGKLLNIMYGMGKPILMGIFSGLMTIIYDKGIKAVLGSKVIYDNQEKLSIVAMLGVAIYNVAGFSQNYIYVGLTILFLTVLFLAYKYGLEMGAIAGAAMGIIFCVWKGDAKYLGVICLMGIVTGIFREVGRISSVVAFSGVLPAMGFLAYKELGDANIVKGVLGAVTIFVLMPKSLAYKYEETINESDENGVKKVLEDKLLNAARAIEMLSGNIFPEPGLTEEINLSDEILNDNPEKKIVDIQGKIWEEKSREDRKLMSEQLNQISNLMNEYSKEIYNFIKIPADAEEYIRYKLKQKNVYLDKIVGIENKNKKREYLCTAKCEKGRTVGTREVAEILSEAFGERLEPSKNSRKVVGSEYSTSTFVKSANFYVTSGVAKKARGENGVSGDNYSIKELENNQLLMGIADGMGCGAGACLESESVIEMLEQFLDTGISSEVALKMINSVMILNSEKEHPATLDYGIIDLHSGRCNLFKMGAAATFVKRGNWVETIKSTSMPIGIFPKVDFDYSSKKLYDDDVVIMVSDGVIESMEGERKEERLAEIVADIDFKSPKEMAELILEKAVSDKTEIRDDMTVLVTKIRENSLDMEKKSA